MVVYGRPEPQGSTRGFVPKGWKRAVITSDNAKLKPWRQQIARMAIEAMDLAQLETFPRETPMAIGLYFYLARPKSLPKKIARPTKKPDIDKLVRGVFDALTGVVIEDDSQFVEMVAAKYFGLPERVEISVEKAVK